MVTSGNAGNGAAPSLVPPWSKAYYEEGIIDDPRGLAYEFDSISFDTPALTYLDYSDYVPKEYPTVNLDSLVEANLNLCADEEAVWQEEHANTFNPINLIIGFKNVEILNLTFEAVEVNCALYL